MSIEYAIIVKSKTRLEALTERFNTKAQAKFYLQRSSSLASSLASKKTSKSAPAPPQEEGYEEYEEEHEIFQESLSQLQNKLSKVVKHKIVDRNFVPSFLFSDKHLVIVIGQDGLVANTAKYANNQPIVAVNPDPTRYDGVLLPFQVNNFLEGVEGVLSQRFKQRNAHFAEARLSDGQRLLAFNDLFIGASSHISARYRLSYRGKLEEQSSSGLIVSTKAGSTGWLSSVFNMAYGVTSMLEGNLAPKQPNLQDQDLLFAVREPFKSRRTSTNLAIGLLRATDQLQIESLMPRQGVIFSDGIQQDFLQFNSGAVATIGLAKEKAVLVEK